MLFIIITNMLIDMMENKKIIKIKNVLDKYTFMRGDFCERKKSISNYPSL